MHRKLKNLFIALLVLVGTCGAVVAMPPSGPHRKGEAAIAVRDLVPGYQQFFTRRFTVPRLESGYEKSWYFTETPTEPSQARQLFAALDEATKQYDHVDLFLLAHGNRYIDVVRGLPEAQRAKLRLVYDTGGSGAHQGHDWKALGVGTFIGHPGGNIAPAFYVYFLPAWIRDQNADRAMKHANDEVYALLYGPLGRLSAHFTDRDGLWAGTEARKF